MTWFEVLKIFFSGAVISFALTQLAIKKFPKWKLLDFPERYSLKRDKIPYPGGLVFLFLSTLVLGLSAFGMFLSSKFFVLAPAVLWLGILSFWDDRKPLSPLLRFFVQVGIASAIFLAGVKIDFIGDPFHATNFELGNFPFISFILTVGWILLLQNAMNFFDGIKGLAPGAATIGFLFLGILGMMRPELFLDPSHADLTKATFLFAGISIGGFWHFWRGKIILGDTGSQTMGFLLATMSIFSGAKIATTLLILGIPLIDAVFVVIRRIFIEKKAPWHGDRKHIHHNLARRIGEQPATITIMAISAGLGTIAVLFQGFEKMIALGGAGVLILGLIVWARRTGSKY
jgi:UDP-GlcNAc:undecaprenyl-phosphate GlcNAc-1-phosphate transferase